MSDYDIFFQSIRGIAESIQSLNRQAVREYTPVVESILRSRSKDASRIEHALDGLLSFCGDESALVLFRKLCRHYWEIDRAATADYISAYRKMWDSEEKVETARDTNAPRPSLPTFPEIARCLADKFPGSGDFPEPPPRPKTH
jgi:hypothetical protein